jgi:hypothetical protein
MRKLPNFKLGFKLSCRFVEHGSVYEDIWSIVFLRVGNGMDLLGGA